MGPANKASDTMGRLLHVCVGTMACLAAAVRAAEPGAEAPLRRSAPRHKSGVTLQLQWYPQAQFAGFFVAKERGFFREAGLPEVTLQWAHAGDRPLERLEQGKVDFCTAWLSDAIAQRARGAGLVHLVQIVQTSTMMLVVRRDSGIVEPADMTGKRVGLWGGNSDVQPNAFFAKYGIKPVIVPQSQSMVPFLRKAVDVASAMHYNEYHKLLEAGLRPEELRVFFFADHGVGFPEDGLYCLETTRRLKPDTCARLVGAVKRGWDYALAHEEETLDVVMAYCRQANARTNRNHQRWMLRSIGEAIRPRDGNGSQAWGRLAPETYARVTRILEEQGLVRQAPSWDAFHRPPAPRVAEEP